MHMRILFLAAIAALLLATGTAHADSPKQTPFGRGLFAGIVEGLLAASTYLSVVEGRQELFCPPEKLNITGEMLQDIIRDFGERHPELRSKNYQMGTIALMAVRDTFPCKPQ
jgi:hypothetical protein